MEPPNETPVPTAGEVRDRLLRFGADALSPTELLEVLLPPRAVPRDLLRTFGSLRTLAAAEAGEIQARGGLGRQAALRLQAAFALGRRVQLTPLVRGRLLRTSADVFEAMGARMQDLRKERFVSILLDSRGRVMREEVVTEGILTASLVHPREVFAVAIREAAAGLILVHNHPSGDPEPSPEDHEVTRRLVAVGELVGIGVEDHVVIGDGAYVSFRERGYL